MLPPLFRRGFHSSSSALLPPRFVDLLTSGNLKPRLSPARQRDLAERSPRGKAANVSLVKKYEERLQRERELANASLEAGVGAGVGAGAAAEKPAKGVDVKSKNQQFRELPYSKSVLEKIEKEKMGRVPKLKVPKTAAKEDDPNLPGDQDPKALQKLAAKFSFVAAAKVKESLPAESEKEVAFVGRSNVGKSSLINALTVGGLARVSDKPGKTQSINFYRYERTHKYLVDLPGYGFAYGKEETIEAWNKLVENYVKERKSLIRLFVLIDSRHGLKLVDRRFLDALNKTNTKYQIVLTKCDQVLPLDLAKRENQIKDELRGARRNAGDPILVSSTQKGGLSKLRRIVSSLLQV